MPSIYVSDAATKVVVLGYGIKVDNRLELTPELFLMPPWVSVEPEELQKHVEGQLEHAAILAMGGISTFALEIIGGHGGKDLALRAWNSLWLFGLMSLASKVPCHPLFAFSDETDARYTLVNRNAIVRPHGREKVVGQTQLDWMRRHYENFCKLIDDNRFSAAMRAFNNAHYLFDSEQKLMLLWAGIEGLLEIDGELRRRIALHAAILSDGTQEEKLQLFKSIKRAYDFRSKVVHGASVKGNRMEVEYEFTSTLLASLLTKCIVLGRTPTANEIDEAALTTTVA
jgi:hypothetical protein